MTRSNTKSARTRAKILDAAALTFHLRGYTATKLKDIADAADMQTGSLYYHFESKAKLMEEVLDKGIREVHAGVLKSQSELGTDASAEQRILRAVQAHLTLLLKNGDYTSTNIRNFGQVPDEVHQHHIKLRNAYADLWRKILRQAQQEGALAADVDLALVRMLLMGALNWSVEWYQPDKTSIEEIAQQVCRMLFHGIGSSKQAKHTPN